MQTFTFNDLALRTMTGEEVFVLYPEALDEIQKRNERINDLESTLQSLIFVALKQREATRQWARQVDGTIEEAQKLLALRTSG